MAVPSSHPSDGFSIRPVHESFQFVQFRQHIERAIRYKLPIISDTVAAIINIINVLSERAANNKWRNEFVLEFGNLLTPNRCWDKITCSLVNPPSRIVAQEMLASEVSSLLIK